MTTVITTTVAPPPAAAAPPPPPQSAYPAAGPAVPAVHSSYATGASLPQYGSLSTLIPAPRKTGGYRINLGEYFRARGEYEHYLAALRMSTPILDKARGWLNLPTGWDLRKSDLEFHQVLKKRQLKKFKREIIRLVEQRKASAAMQYKTVPCAFPGPLGSVPHHHGTHAAPLHPVNFATAPLVAPVQAEAIPAGTSYGVSKLPHLAQ